MLIAQRVASATRGLLLDNYFIISQCRMGARRNVMTHNAIRIAFVLVLLFCVSEGRAGQSFKPGESFKDCAECPEMIVVPAGSFTMGSRQGDPGHDGSQAPQHTVTFAQPFAVGTFPVTFAEWDACAAVGGCGRYKPDDAGWGRGDRPVINVSWNDAKAYVGLAIEESGQPVPAPF